MAHPSLKADTAAELIEMGRSDAAGLFFASAGPGSMGHLAGELLKIQSGLKMSHVAYKGGGQAITDVVAGQVPLLVTALATAGPFLKDGRLKAVAVTSARRVVVRRRWRRWPSRVCPASPASTCRPGIGIVAPEGNARADRAPGPCRADPHPPIAADARAARDARRRAHRRHAEQFADRASATTWRAGRRSSKMRISASSDRESAHADTHDMQDQPREQAAVIRLATPADYQAWRESWLGYQAFYKVEIDEPTTADDLAAADERRRADVVRGGGGRQQAGRASCTT